MKVSEFTHNGRTWSVVLLSGSYYARDDRGNDTGPYSTVREAEEWVRGIGF